jgi:hypothetical protein
MISEEVKIINIQMRVFQWHGTQKYTHQLVGSKRNGACSTIIGIPSPGTSKNSIRNQGKKSNVIPHLSFSTKTSGIS